MPKCSYLTHYFLIEKCSIICTQIGLTSIFDGIIQDSIPLFLFETSQLDVNVEYLDVNPPTDRKKASQSHIHQMKPASQHPHTLTDNGWTWAVAEMGADLTDVTAALLFCWVETPGNPSRSVSKDTVTDQISTESSERPEIIEGRGERCRDEKEANGGEMER